MRISLDHNNFSDIHFGTQDPKKYYEEELVPLLEYLWKQDRIGIITSAGELYNKREYYDSPVAEYSYKFISDLSDICAERDGVLALCKGTNSHEGEQYNLLKNIPGIYIFDKVGYLEVDKYIFRFLPDISYSSYEEFADNAFGRYADVTVMHGMIEGAIKIAEKDHLRKKEVIIKQKDLLKYTKLYTVAGHVHDRLSLHPDIWYTGATSASSYKDANKTAFGMDHIRIYDNNEYDINFIRNKNTRVFKTENVTRLFKDGSLDKIKSNLVLKKKDMQEKEFIRLDIEDDLLSADDRANFRAIKAQFGSIFDFNLIIGNRIDYKLATSLQTESAMVLDTSIPVENKIIADIADDPNIKYDIKKRLTTERIVELLEREIEDLMGE